MDQTDQVVPGSTPPPGRRLGVRTSPCSREESPFQSKRRKMKEEEYPPSPCTPLDSPQFKCDLSSYECSFDEGSSAAESPDVANTKKKSDFRRRYKKDELWAAIRSDYQYLMDEEIIETCKSTESDLSWESDDVACNTKVSFAEFAQQFNEISDWLNHIQLSTQRKTSSSLSENYLNQTYHEEMLKRSPRRKLFNDYAKQLMRRYPNMKDEIVARLQRLNNKWEALEEAISPKHGYQDQQTMLTDVEQDLNGLRRWLHGIENQLLPLSARPNWNTEQLQEKLKEYQILQRDIEAHSRVVTAVVKLCDRLEEDDVPSVSDSSRKESLKLVATNLERHWKTIWLQSLEWQCRLEQALASGKGLASTHLLEGSSASLLSFSTPLDSCIDVFGRRQDADRSFDASNCSDILEDSLGSDHSSDVIPFPESEYEKISVDSDGLTDDSIGRAIAVAYRGDRGKHGRSDSDQGTDSALGRSLSDRSINTEHPPSLSPTPETLSGGQVIRAVVKVVTANSTQMRAAVLQDSRSGSPVGVVPRPQKMAPGVDCPDVGYSSENHSAEEVDRQSESSCNEQTEQVKDVDDVSLQVRKGIPIPGFCDLDTESDWNQSQVNSYDSSLNLTDLIGSSDPACSAERSLSGMENEITSDSSSGLPARSSRMSRVDSRCRYSLSDRYADCKDLVMPSDLGMARDALASSVTSDSSDGMAYNRTDPRLTSLVATRSNFYCMTTIETDSEANSSATERGLLRVGSATASSNTLPEQKITFRMDCPDVGYSSENHSNEELEPLGRGGSSTSQHSEKGQGSDSGFRDVKSAMNQAQCEIAENTTQEVPCSKIADYASASCSEQDRSGACTDTESDIHGSLPYDDYDFNQKESDCNGFGSGNSAENVVVLEIVEEQVVPSRDSFFDSPDRVINAGHRPSHEPTEIQQNARENSDWALDAKSPHETVDGKDEYSKLSCELNAPRVSESVLKLVEQAESLVKDEYGMFRMNSASLYDGRSKKTRRHRRRPRIGREFSDFANGSCDASSEGTSSGTDGELSTTLSDQDDYRPSAVTLRNRKRKRSSLSASQSLRSSPAKDVAALAHTRCLAKRKRDRPVSMIEMHELQKRLLDCNPLSKSESAINDLSAVDKSSLQSGIPQVGRFSRKSRKRRTKRSSPSQSQTITSGVGAAPESASPQVPSPVETAERRLDTPVDHMKRKTPSREPTPLLSADVQTSCSEVDKPDKHLSSDVSARPGGISSIESCSENAWDNYQAAPYPNVSEDATEEKLDPSRLADWDQSAVECDEESPLDNTFDAVSPSDKAKKLSNSKLSMSKFLADSSRTLEPDSDSDLEDFQQCIEDARHALRFTEGILTRQKDTFETGIFLDPSEYAEPIATCETNIRCLDEVLLPLESEELELGPVAEDYIQDLREIIERWKGLESLAYERQEQSIHLRLIYREMVSVKNSLQDISDTLEDDCFQDFQQLETAIKYIKENKAETRDQEEQLKAIRSKCLQFSEAYPSIPMGKFLDEIGLLESALHDMSERTDERVSELQSALIAWYNFRENSHELSYLLSQERKQLQCLEVNHEVLPLANQDMQGMLSDLKAIEAELSNYERRMQALHVLKDDVGLQCDDEVRTDMKALVAISDNELAAIRSRCATLTAGLEYQIMRSKLQHSESVADNILGSSAVVSDKDGQLWLKLLFVSLSLAASVVFLAYLLDPNSCGFDPTIELHYVEGPPPT